MDATKNFTSPAGGGKKIQAWREELDGYYKEMSQFRYEQPDEIFMKLSGWTSRASYLRGLVFRSENRPLTAFRTKELDPFIAECDRQFKMWSRVFSVQTIDWQNQKGQI